MYSIHKIGRKKLLLRCYLIFFWELSKKRRKRIRKHAKGRMCTYAREGNNAIAKQNVSTQDALNEKTDIILDIP